MADMQCCRPTNSITEHCTLLCNVIRDVDFLYPIEPNENRRIEQATEWLLNAAMIDKVSLLPDPNNTSMMCRPAWEYEEANAKLKEDYITALTRFHFIFLAFETLIKLLYRKKSNMGSPLKTQIYIKNYFPSLICPNEYTCKLYSLRKFVLRSCFLDDLSTAFRQQDSKTFRPSAGIKIVNELRNTFAHGSFIFPEPDDWRLLDNKTSSSYELQCIRTSSRLTLMTIQFLLLAYSKERNFYTFDIYDTPSYKPEDMGTDLISLIFFAHLDNGWLIKRSEENSMQQHLFEESNPAPGGFPFF